MERTLVILKPDAVQRGLCGRLIARFEEKGLQIIGLKMIQIARDLAERHYQAHKGKPFYESLLRFITSCPVVVMALQGKDAISVVRRMMGHTFGPQADPGTIRGDYGVSNAFNLIHGSDSPESARQELQLFFRPEELLDWTPVRQIWLYDMSKGQPE